MHALMTYKEEEFQARHWSFLTSTLDKVSFQLKATAALFPEKIPRCPIIRCLVGLQDQSERFGEYLRLMPRREANHDSSNTHLVTQSLYRLCYPGSHTAPEWDEQRSQWKYSTRIGKRANDNKEYHKQCYLFNLRPKYSLQCSFSNTQTMLLPQNIRTGFKTLSHEGNIKLHEANFRFM